MPYKKHRSVVVIPLYKLDLSNAEWFSLKQTLKVLHNHPCTIICPDHLFSELLNASRNWGAAIKIKAFPNNYFKSINGYNRLLRSPIIYQAFSEYEYMLIVQTDALILQDKLDEWCERGYSYVGAPFFKGFSNPTMPLEFIGVGNGGLSLRHIPDFLQCQTAIRYIPNILAQSPKNIFDLKALLKFIKHHFIFCFNFEPLFPKVNEDVYWGLLIPKIFPFFKVASPMEAIKFAFDAEPRYLFELNKHQLPFGCHAWERYDHEFWKSALVSLNIENTISSKN
jgi:hypothetical protein